MKTCGKVGIDWYNDMTCRQRKYITANQINDSQILVLSFINIGTTEAAISKLRGRGKIEEPASL